ncbi:MAG: alpha/beta hydrolase [bacterium]|nr:alpha/beta hydrolase [bacterium]
MQQCKPREVAADLDSFLDSPQIASEVYFPRQVRNEPPPGAIDYNIPITDDVSLGARWYLSDASLPTVLIFHGNGETVPDYNFVARGFLELAKLNVFVVDYRGYGWSTGRPTLRSLIEDARPVVRFFLRTLEEETARLGSDAARPPRPILFGRSLGSAPASEIAASELAANFSGLILDSGFSDVGLLLQLFRIDAGEFEPRVIEMFSNENKLRQSPLPALVIHGEKDHLIPAEHARRNHASLKEAGVEAELLLIPEAGHNDLMLEADTYFGAIERFVRRFVRG